MAAVTEGDVLSALKQCYDPEIPVNIVDLGLIYAVRLESVAGGDQEARQDVSVDRALTSPGCPSHVMIGEQVKARLEQLPGIRTATENGPKYGLHRGRPVVPEPRGKNATGD